MSFQNYQLLKTEICISFKIDTTSAGEVDRPEAVTTFAFAQNSHAFVSLGNKFWTKVVTLQGLSFFVVALVSD